MNSGKQANDLFKTLTDTQKRFLLEKDYSDKKRIGDWIPFLEDIVQYDVLIDRTTRNLRLAINFIGAVAIFNLIVALLTSSVFLGVGGILLVFMTVFQRIKRKAYFKRDLQNHLRLFFFPLIREMQKTLSPEAVFEVEFHLREKDNIQDIISFSVEAESGIRLTSKVRKEHYEFEVMNGEQSQKVIGTNLSYVDFMKQLRPYLPAS